MVRPEALLPDRRPRHVLLANAGRARLLGRDPDNGALRELDDFVNPRARLKAATLDRERPGRSAMGSRRTAYDPPTEPDEHERQRFAHELARHLEALALEHRLGCWVLAASSPFLGTLRQALGPHAAGLLVQHAERDLTQLALHLLEPRLRQLLAPGPAPGRAA
ncbi:MAG: host attachment protein [Betaproteobacteria bacterium]|jgi:protein required for attachment to host cells|nr:host attachment protein [Rubrivivax sp.]